MSEMVEDGWNGLEVAKYLDVRKDTVRSWIKKMDIPAHKFGKLWKYKRSELVSGLRVVEVQWIRKGMR